MMAAVMGSFGERLQREREKRGITLEEMSETTKVTSRCLRALEEEDFDKLPGGIFNKGFVRAYARHLSLDEDQAVADFIAASGGEKEQPLPDPVIPRAVVLGQRVEKHFNWPVFAVAALLLVAVVTAAWKLGPSALHRAHGALTAHSNPAAAAATPQPAAQTPGPASPPTPAQAAPATSEAPAAAPAPPSAPEAAAQAPPAAQSVPEPPAKAPPPSRAANRKNKNGKNKAVAAAAKATAKASAKAAAAAPAPPPAPASSPSPASSRAFVVHVRATQDAWVQIVADGKLVSEGVLVPPAEKRVPAAKEVVIKTGNAAGVEVSFNGQPLPTLGEENQMATVTLTAAGAHH